MDSSDAGTNKFNLKKHKLTMMRQDLEEKLYEYNELMEVYILNRIRDGIRVSLGQPLDDIWIEEPWIHNPDKNIYIRCINLKYDYCDRIVDNLDNIAFHGTYRFGKKYDPSWDNVLEFAEDDNATPGKEYMSESIINPTWSQIFTMANTAIITTQDYSHIDVEVFDEDKHDKNLLWFNMGS